MKTEIKERKEETADNWLFGSVFGLTLEHIEHIAIAIRQFVSITVAPIQNCKKTTKHKKPLLQQKLPVLQFVLWLELKIIVIWYVKNV